MRVGFKRERDYYCSSSQAYMQWQIFSVEILGGNWVAAERESQCFWARKTRRKYHHMKQDRVGHCTIMLITFFCDFSNISVGKVAKLSPLLRIIIAGKESLENDNHFYYSVKLIVNKRQNAIHHFEWRSSRWILVAQVVFLCLNGCLLFTQELSHDYLTIRQPCVQWLVAGKQ